MNSKTIVRVLARTLAAGAASAFAFAQAASITGVSPQGEVARVRQVQVQFDQAPIPFGDPKAPLAWS